MKPTIGRTVHIASSGAARVPAIIVAVNDDQWQSLNVQAFLDQSVAGVVYMSGVPHESTREHADQVHWRWPPREY